MNSRSFFYLGIVLISGIGFFQEPRAMTHANDTIPFYVGTYTQGESRGIYEASLNTQTGELGALALAAELENPSFLALHPTRPVIYAVGELDRFDGTEGGVVHALKRDSETGQLTLINQRPSGGAHPCHVSVTPCGRYVLLANYSSGSIASFPVQADGGLAPMAGFVQHEGSSIDARRQQGPHAHSIQADPGSRFFLAADLGMDKILIYGMDQGRFVPHSPAYARLAPGSGPRHLTFHANGRYVYVINELQSTVTAFAYDPTTGTLTEIQTVTTLPKGFPGKNTTAEIQIDSTGQFLYGSNRGHDSIALFRTDPKTGKLTACGQMPSGGKDPRHFAMDPTGFHLLAAHQTSNTIVGHRIDGKTGRLEPTGHVLTVAAPVCILFTR